MAVAHSVSATVTATNYKYEQLLVGARNGVNRVYTTPDYFLPTTFELYHNGRRMIRSGLITEIEYEVQESGGVGTGFDTVLFLAFSPIASSVLRANYTAL